MNSRNKNRNNYKTASSNDGTAQNSAYNRGKSGKFQKNKGKLLSSKESNQNRRQEKKPVRKDYPEGAVPEIVRPVISADAQRESASQNEFPRELTQMYDEETQEVIGFEEAIKKILEKEALEPGETLVYSGGGTFSVVSIEQEGRRKKRIVKRKIAFEKHRDNDDWKNTLRYGLGMSYTPNPQPLSELYTDDEVANFELNRHR